MEFNPLDLLASAAELQQKQDDPPDVTMVTRRRNNSANSKLSVEIPQKENTEVVNNNNNNNSIKSKSIAIIKKIKINGNPEIEKMLNEHNYGNAKRSQRYDKNVESGFEMNEGYRNSTALSGSTTCTSETKPSHVITTFGRNGDKVSVITKTSSQVTDSECKCGKELSVKSPSKGWGSYSSCKCRANPGDKSSEQLACSKCVKSECDCPRPSGEHSQVGSQFSDKTEGQLPDSLSLIQDCENKHTDSSNTKDCNNDPHTRSSTEKQHDDITQCTSDVYINSETSKQVNTEINLKFEEEIDNQESLSCKSKQNEVILSDREVSSADIDLGVKKSGDMVKCSVLNTDVVSNLESKPTTSDRKKLPYVKVIPSPSKSNTEVDMPQTLVINISNKTLNTSTLEQSASEQSPSLLEMDMLKSQKCEKSDKNTSDTGDISTLLTTEKDRGQLDTQGDIIQSFSPVKPKLDISTCDTKDLVKSESFDSLKRLEISDSICSDISSTSVHLLSPDRRNPDSMGIVESPVTAPLHDLSGLSETEGECDKNITNLDGSSVSQSGVSAPSNISSGEGAEGCTDQGLVTDTDSHGKGVADLQPESSCSDSLGEVKELVKDSRLTSESEEKLYFSYNSANDQSTEGSNDVPIFRFESDHCYAGLPRETNCSRSSLENEEQSSSESEELKTPMDSIGEVSQDSGYEDVTHSPDTEMALPSPESSQKLKTVKSLVPVLISVNNTGCLTLHSDPKISKQLGQQVLTVADSTSIDKGGLKLIPGTSLSAIPQSPIILSPVVNSAIPHTEQPPLVQTNAENILGLLRPTSPDVSLNTSQEQTSPPKFGKFRIGTFASFSNTGMGMDSPKASLPATLTSQVQAKTHSTPVARAPRANGVKSVPTVADTLGSLVQKVKSSLSPALQVDNKFSDHIQHDHDYCLKSLVPSLVSSVLEAKLQKEAAVKGKLPHGKLKKSDSEMLRQDSKTGKRKRSCSSVYQDLNEDCDLEDDSDCYSQPEFVRPKTRAEKYIEQKSAEPKVKITGSSTFQDQFVYFMNTKKRSRRRESRDSPLPVSGDRVFIPPKPGDIVVPHLSDQDIENLKKRSRLKGLHGCNSLRNEFMAAKLSNTPFNGQSQQAETAVDEKSIINTILSLENENLVSPEESYNESMELYGQGLGTDIMNFLPDQMNFNLTQEQMDLLYSAVDEVQNSSPGLVGEEKLVSSDEEQTAFSHFEMPEVYDKTEAKQTASESREKTPVKAEDKSGNLASTEDTVKKTDAVSSTDKADVKTEVQSPADTIEVKSSPQSEFMVPETKEPAESTEEKSPVPQSEEESKESAMLPPTLNVPQTEDSSLHINSNPSNLFNKSPFVAVTVSENVDSVKNTVTSGNITSSLNSEIVLPTLDKSSLDILGNEFRLDKADLFTDSGVPSGPIDTSAPWIVTVSMYWNDLPAIMINNQPYVRLVDIHKQILPAKDTGILKKRCQLMHIEVENCSEMQRYFLVQYGKAFNSKSTLIVSKDNAKELIGYYVDPQPKTSRIEDHKSIIDHRREQLRRIALARRAAIRARKLPGRKEEDDPRAIKDEVDVLPMQGEVKAQSVPDRLGAVVEPVTAVSQGIPHQGLKSAQVLPPQSLGVAPKRATRHKKINFLEMLRGDPTNQPTEDDGNADQDDINKKSESSELGTSSKKGKPLKNKKVKIVNVKYTIQSESSEETESNCTESELSSTESTSEPEMVVKKHSKHRLHLSDIKSKTKTKLGSLKKQNRMPLKVKISTGKNKMPPTSMPVTVQVVNKTLTPAVPFYRTKYGPSDSRNSISSPSIDSLSGNNQTHGHSVLYNDQSFEKTFETVVRKNETSDNSYYTEFESDPYSKQGNIPEFKKVIVEQINEADVKIPTTLPDEILEEESKTREMETNTDFDVTGQESNEDKSVEVTEEFDKSDDLSMADVNDNLKTTRMENMNGECSEESPLCSPFPRSDRNISTESQSQDSKEDRSRFPAMTDRPLLIKKGKEIGHLGNAEVPLRIVHREASPLNINRSRSQLGELFIEKYIIKKSPCIRCYTCRKMMSVDNFMRHLHDIANGGMLSIDTPRTIDFCETDLSADERKVWDVFQRKKELFDNNQLPSPDIVQEGLYGIDSDSNQSLPENINGEVKTSGPRIITTPVSPMKKAKPHSFSRRNPPHLSVESADGVRCSGRKRKKKQLYPFEEYTFAKFPRLHGQNNVKDTMPESPQ